MAFLCKFQLKTNNMLDNTPALYITLCNVIFELYFWLNLGEQTYDSLHKNYIDVVYFHIGYVIKINFDGAYNIVITSHILRARSEGLNDFSILVML